MMTWRKPLFVKSGFSAGTELSAPHLFYYQRAGLSMEKGSRRTHTDIPAHGEPAARGEEQISHKKAGKNKNSTLHG